MNYKIHKFTDLTGWYSFKDIPQDNCYIKIDCLNCGSDRKALNRAKKIFGKENTYRIIEKGRA